MDSLNKLLVTILEVLKTILAYDYGRIKEQNKNLKEDAEKRKDYDAIDQDDSIDNHSVYDVWMRDIK